jgi:hypothetical protein
VKKLNSKLSNKTLAISRFSKVSLVAFAIIFATTAGYFIYKSFAAGTFWYVDPSASGTNSGTSWANAWTSLSSINWTNVQPGDTVYFSGGTTSQTYTGTWTINKSGTAASPVTIAAGQDAGHNGTVIFDYNGFSHTSTTSAGITIGGSYVTINGSVGANNKIQINNMYNTSSGTSTQGIYTSGGTGIVIDHVTFINNNNPIKFSNPRSITVKNSSFQQTRGDAAISMAANTPCCGQTWDSNKIFNNDFEGLYNNNGPDTLQILDGTSIYNNTFKETLTTVTTSGQHPDNIQYANSSYVKIYNNQFTNIGDSAIDLGAWNFNSAPNNGINVHDIYIYNNVFRILTTIDPYPDFIRLYNNPGRITSVTNLKVMNNLFVDSNAGGGIPVVNFCYYDNGCDANSSGQGSEISNNIFVNDGNGSSSGPMLYLGAGAGSGWTAHNNVYYRSSGAYISWKGTTYTAANFISSIDTAGKTSLPSFKSYAAFSASNDFHLQSTDTVAKDSGISFSSYFTTDRDGIARPQGSAWDRGPYEFSSGIPPPSDTTAPTVSLTAPAAGATVTGSSVTVSANASDNVGVSGVQFKLDGANLGSEDTSSPYSITWNTTSASNGSHTLTAVARDAAGNSTTASNVTVTVSNAGKTGDVNNDGSVNIFDLSILLSDYGKTTAQSSNPACDLNSDANIDIFDLSILLSNYGT